VQDPPPIKLIRDLAQLTSQGQPLGKFELRLTTAALELAERADALAADSDAAEHARLAALLGESGTLDQLNRRLCTLIQHGALTQASPGLAAHLRATTMEKLAIDQPTYAAYRRALERSEG
jgi:hypothetical protein